MDFRCLLAMLLVNMPTDVVLLVCISVGSCLWSIYLSVWHAGMASRQLIKRAPSLYYAAENMTTLIICAMVMTEPLFGGME